MIPFDENQRKKRLNYIKEYEKSYPRKTKLFKKK